MFGYGRILATWALLLAFGLAAKAQDTSVQSRKYALLIGVSKYDAGLAELPCCQNDLNELRACLLGAGFPAENIAYLHPEAGESLRPTKANIESQLALRMKLPAAGDQVVVAFSGQGVLIDGTRYLCPVDARLDDPAGTMISLDAFHQIIGGSPATHKLLILDAWRSDPLKGVKAARVENSDNLKPPRGLRVLSSCDSDQVSVDDPKLKRGVFMYYLTEGWKGAADRDAEGNGDGRISLDELYFYAHAKTKIHVANGFAALQLPTLSGDSQGKWDLATLGTQPKVDALSSVPSPATNPLPSVPSPDTPPTTSAVLPPMVGNAKSLAPPPMHPLLTQADALFARAEYDQAINAYTSLISNNELTAGVRRAARLGRGSAYLAKGGKDNIQKALIDHKAAGHEAVSLPVRSGANLMVSSNAVGAVRVNEVVQISMINGDWVWVASVNGNKGKRGYIKWEAILPSQ